MINIKFKQIRDLEESISTFKMCTWFQISEKIKLSSPL